MCYKPISFYLLINTIIVFKIIMYVYLEKAYDRMSREVLKWALMEKKSQKWI